MLGSECLFTCFEPPLKCRRRPDSYLVTTPIPHWAFMNVTVRARIRVCGPGVSRYPQVNDTFVPEAAELVGGEGGVLAGGFKTVTHIQRQASPSSARTDPRQRIRLPARPRPLKYSLRAPHHVSVASDVRFNQVLMQKIQLRPQNHPQSPSRRPQSRKLQLVQSPAVSLMSLTTTSEQQGLRCLRVAFIRCDRWFGRAVSRSVRTVLLAQTRGFQNTQNP